LVGSKKIDNRKIEWTDESAHAFEQCKEQLRTATTLTHPAPTAKMSLMVDASDKALGSVSPSFNNILMDIGSQLNSFQCV
jgi:hypothetical protein